MLQMYKTIFVIVALIAAISFALGVLTPTIDAYTTTILTDGEMAHIAYKNGTSVDKPLAQYDFSIGPQHIPYSVTMVGQ